MFESAITEKLAKLNDLKRPIVRVQDHHGAIQVGHQHVIPLNIRIAWRGQFRDFYGAVINAICRVILQTLIPTICHQQQVPARVERDPMRAIEFPVRGPKATP